MRKLSRRTIVGATAAGATALCIPRLATSALAAAPPQCAPPGLAPFLPSHLTVDCASRRNLHAFLQYPDYLGLAAVVSMATVRTKLGTLPAGNLSLFPYLKPKGQQVRGKAWPVAVPASLTLYMSGSPMPGATLPPDEYFLRYVLMAPWKSFIGFLVDEAHSKPQAQMPWFSNVDLPDGDTIGVDWTSANLNEPWFDGSHWIPDTTTCNGQAWRRIITDALEAASRGAC
jgi:hypothetical protein